MNYSDAGVLEIGKENNKKNRREWSRSKKLDVGS